MTPLEALEIIKNASTIYVGCASDIYTRYSFECKLIETELKESEYYKMLCNAYVYFIHDDKHKYPVLELGKIIKTIDIIRECFDFNGFEEFIPNSKWYQNEENQKILKEVLHRKEVNEHSKG